MVKVYKKGSYYWALPGNPEAPQPFSGFNTTSAQRRAPKALDEGISEIPSESNFNGPWINAQILDSGEILLEGDNTDDAVHRQWDLHLSPELARLVATGHLQTKDLLIKAIALDDETLEVLS